MTFKDDKSRLADRVCLVTGSSRGIGRAVAEKYAALGAAVILHGRDEQALRRVREQLPGAGHGWVAADLAEPEGVERLADGVLSERQDLDVLVHSAGALGPRVELSEYPPAEWELVLRINLTAPFLLTQALLPALRRGASPSVILVSSGAGRRGRARWGAYAVSKFGLEGLSQVWADELRSAGIRVNAVDPGATRTAMRASAFPDEDPETLPRPQDITPLFVELAGPNLHAAGARFQARAYTDRVTV